MELKTIYSSNIPIDCYILKNRLESDGVDCFIFDDYFVWVFPFRAVAIGGVKLKVPLDQKELAENIINLIKNDKLCDENGEYEIAAAFEHEFSRQQEILSIKSRIRKEPSLINKPNELNITWLNENEISSLLDEEKLFLKFSTTKLYFSWNQFWANLFDFDSSIFSYLRIRPVEYYLDKDLVDRYNTQTETKSEFACPTCKSKNVSYGLAIDYKWNLLYLLWSYLIFAPLPFFRKKYHCFDCGFNFKFREKDITI